MSSTLPAFRRLFDAHYATVHDAALGSGMSEADAQDLAQEVWVAVFRRISEYDQCRPFRRWLLGITFQLARNLRRQNRRARRILDRDKDPADVSPSALLTPATPEEELARQEESAMAKAEFRRLRPELRAVFLMAEVENLRQEDIAARLGLTKTQVAWRLHAAWAALDRAIYRRRLAGLLTAILAAGISSLTAIPAEAQTLARRVWVRIAWKRFARHVAIVGVVGMFPIPGAALPVSTPALAEHAPERAVQAPPGPEPGATGEGKVNSAVQAPPRPTERFKGDGSPTPPVEDVREKVCGAKSDRCDSPPETQPSKLAGEVALLQRVRSARRMGNIALARSILREYDERYTDGALRKARDQLAAEIAAYMDQ
jgi:RNA polymerase sigma-70 factor (ECF subfamily)